MPNFNPEDVARWLRNNPQSFAQLFETHADLFADVTIPHPHGGRAIPIADRQMLSLRERNKTLEAKLAELIRFGEENDAIGEKVHRLSVAVLPVVALDGVFSALYGSLREDFRIPHVAMRLWRGTGTSPEFGGASTELRDYAARLEHAYCGPNQTSEAAAWFGVAADHVRSMALLPLREGAGTFGLLALGAEDPHRFYPEMGTLYLVRIAELASGALTRFV